MSVPAPATPRPSLAVARLRGMLGGRILVLVVTGLVGFLLVSQLRGTERFTQRLEAESEGDLARILASLTSEADALRDEISALKLQLLSLETSSQRDEAAAEAARRQLEALQVLAGTVPVTGPGIVVRIRDEEAGVGYDNLIDAVQELRDAGAEAIAINGLRVGVRSSLADDGGRITLDGTPLTRPYEVAAIGQAATLEGGLKIPGGVIDTLTAIRGVDVEVQRATRVELPALAEAPTFRVARPVGSGS